MKFRTQWLEALKTMRFKSYWNRPNTVEFFCLHDKDCYYFPRPIAWKTVLVALHICFGFKPCPYMVIDSKDSTHNYLVQYFVDFIGNLINC